MGLQLVGVVAGAVADPSDRFTLVAAGVSVILGTVMLFIGLGYYAAAKGHSPAWGLMGFLSVIGLIVLGLLPDRVRDRNVYAQLPRVDRPPGPDDFHYECIDCGYILSGATTTFCPECGRRFDPDDPDSMRLVDPTGQYLGDTVVAPWTARWSMICGIFALLMFCLPLFNFAFIGCAIGFGHHARAFCRRHRYMIASNRMALAGLIMGYLALALLAVAVLMVFIS